MDPVVLRGDIHWVNFGPAREGEPGLRRPAVIVSANGANAAVARLGRGAVTMVALSTSTRVLHQFEVALPSELTGLQMTSKAQAQLVRAVSVSRIGARVGTVPPRLMREIDDALRLHLGL